MKYIFLTFSIIFLIGFCSVFGQEKLRSDEQQQYIDTVTTFGDNVINPDRFINTQASIPDEVDASCVSFFNLLIKGNVNKAYDELLKGSPLSLDKEKIKIQINKTNEAIKVYGDISGFEQAGAEYISLSYLKVKYMSLHPLNPMLWTFTYYNSPTIGWILLNLKLSDTI